MSAPSDPDDVSLRVLSAWFCPYCDQVRIAFLHRQLPHHVIEALRWPEDDPAKSNMPYEKSEELLRHSPAGLVPTIVSSDGVHAISEMIPAIEFADDFSCPGPKLMPADPWEKARARTTADWIQRRVCGAFFETLMPGDAERQSAAFKQIVESLEHYGNGCVGPYFSGRHLGLPDAVLFPFASRIIYVIPHYRGEDYALPHSPSLAKFWAWYDAVQQEPAVIATILSEENLISSYLRYADGSACTKVADAIRDGESAHDAAAGSIT